jgi:hypothetical protein
MNQTNLNNKRNQINQKILRNKISLGIKKSLRTKISLRNKTSLRTKISLMIQEKMINQISLKNKTANLRIKKIPGNEICQFKKINHKMKSLRKKIGKIRLKSKRKRTPP